MIKRWERINRKNVYKSKFLDVYEDKVKLPNGVIIPDYTVNKKPDIVVIIATDKNNNVIILQEYKYAAGKILLTLPAGHIEEDELPINTARRELLEETGFEGEKYENIGILYDYPTKDMHKVFVVRVKNIKKTKEVLHEETEQINFELVSKSKLQSQVKSGKWQVTSSLAALAISRLLT